MKKPFSIILSLVLLVSSLAIPMPVSADGTLTADEAYAQLNAAVNNLEPNPNLYSSVDNMNFFAQPAGSTITPNSSSLATDADGVIDNGDETTTTVSVIKKSEANSALEPNLGVSAIEIKSNYAVDYTTQGLHKGDLHAVRFNKNGDVAVKGTGQTDVCINEIGYLVFYVKTNRDLKLTFGSHNYSNQAISILNGETAKTVNATDGVYQPVVIDFNDIDWPTVAAPTYYASSTVWSSFIGIEEIAGEPAGTIRPEDDIVFGRIKVFFDTCTDQVLVTLVGCCCQRSSCCLQPFIQEYGI